ncbi:MAG: oligopeptide transporter, OPT family [Verrucomicrobia bacterium]|nr:oligopeptide transporter, OPT family [Verrucomicrobiota bacterium]
MPTHKPYISAKDNKTREFTFRAVFLGILLGLIFGVGNAYLGLKVGTTVSASIPAAVMSIALLRAFSKHVSILEHNIVQTIASVGEGLAGGVIFTVPALFLLGEPPAPSRIFLLAALGGILGILFMIPMRRYIIVHEHGKLPFPEGTACSHILLSTESSQSKAWLALIGIATGALYRVLSGALYLFKETPSWVINSFQRTAVSIDCTPALLGVGFIVGPRISGILFAGGALGWLVLIPLIRFFGTGEVLQMPAEGIWSNYIRYIGAGALIAGGFLSIIKILPIILKTLHMGFNELFQTKARSDRILRTERDISLRWLLIGSALIILTLWLFPGLPMNFLTIVLLALLGFFFSAVTSLTVGIVGSTSNPVSGMTLTTLLITCLVFVTLGWTERVYLIAALTMSIVVNVAIALAGATSQDLKTGYILGATPRTQQLSEIIGVILPALAVGGTLYLLNTAYGFGSTALPAPQGTMLALIAQGVIEGNVPMTLILIGVVLGLLIEVCKLPVLPFAIGLYLPFSLSTGMLVGGLASAFVKKHDSHKTAHDRGTLASSGLVAGDACMGVLIALMTVAGWIPADGPSLLPDWFSLACYGLLTYAVCHFVLKPPKSLSSN